MTQSPKLREHAVQGLPCDHSALSVTEAGDEVAG
jgi:hypothetical protein